MRYQIRTVKLFNANKQHKIFDFKTQEEEDEVKGAGTWKENFRDFAKVVEVEKVKETATAAEPEAENVSEVVPFQCTKCEFIGKNELSLKTHMRHRH